MALIGWPKLEWRKARIETILVRTPRVKSYLLRLPAAFPFRAGQHVDVRLTAEDGYQTQRSYSIASAPGQTREQGSVIELMIEKLETGEVSPFFHDVAEVGDEIEMRGPIGGHFIWPAGDDAPVILVAGGSGLAPILSMARERAASGSLAPMALIYSARNHDEVICREELETLHDQRNGFELAVALTRDKARRASDFSRRIDAAMVKDVLARAPLTTAALPPRAYVCGSNPFVEAATRALIAVGVTADAIRTERYGG
jgi:ferredoxin-NADP reductase